MMKNKETNKWRNLILIVVVFIFAVFYIFTVFMVEPVRASTDMEESVSVVFENNNYSKELFFSELHHEADGQKLLRLKSDLEKISAPEDDLNALALKNYYILATDLKLYEKEVIADIETYALDENYYCEYIDEIIDIDLNMSTMNDKFEGLRQIKDDYLGGYGVGYFEQERFVLAPKMYSEFSDYVFTVCVVTNIDLEEEIE
jgi:hypothetical protein